MKGRTRTCRKENGRRWEVKKTNRGERLATGATVSDFKTSHLFVFIDEFNCLASLKKIGFELASFYDLSWFII